jgi:hypothetical protein
LKLKISLDDEDALALGVGLRNYANTLRDDDKLMLSLRARVLSRDLAIAAKDEQGIAESQLWLLMYYRKAGDWADAEAAYQAFKETSLSSQKDFWRAAAEVFWCETLVAREMAADAALDQAWEMCLSARNAWGLPEVARLRSESALQRGDPAGAAAHFTEAITMARKSGSSSIFEYRGGLARAYAMQGQRDEALRLIEEGVDDLSAAEVYLLLGDHANAKESGLKAYEDAWADGEPDHAWWWYLKRARAVLKALNVPEPKLPLMNKSKDEKIPYEDEIRAFIEKLKAEKSAVQNAKNDDSDFDNFLDDYEDDSDFDDSLHEDDLNE